MPELAEREQAPGQARPGRGRWVGLPGWLVVVVPALAGFVIAVAGVSGPSLWRDEAYTKDAISRSLSHLFAVLHQTDAVHGAYYVVVHFFAEVFGTSDTALRFPSVCAMAVAAGFTAAIGRRAARLAGGGWADATGLLAGLLFAVAPYMTYYAQMARPYAFVTMSATIASYLLLRAATAATEATAATAAMAGAWRWWCGYGLAVGCAGLFNTFGLLILPAHALTLLAVRAPKAAWPRRIARPWLIAAVAAVLVLSPLLLISFHQRGQISWLPRPRAKTVVNLFRDFAGSEPLVAPVGSLALGGVLAGVLGGRRWSPAAVALPWLVVPPGFLLAVSLVKPVYDVRYVEFCLPALAILVAAGLVGLVRLVAATPLARIDARLAWLPSAIILVVLAVMLIAPQHAIRQSSTRPDNLRLAAEIVAANERPGDVVFYLPDNMRVLGTGYPGPFSRLRDLAVARSPIASRTLTGTEITSPAELARRFTDVNRVWIITGANNYKFPIPATPLDQEKMTLVAGLHIVRRWQAGQVMLTLFAR